MSEMDAAPVSEPTSTSAAAEAAYEAIEEPVVSGNTPEPAAEPAPSEPVGEIDSLLHAEGFTEPRRQDGRENRIPYSKVKKIIENGLKKGRTEWDTTKSQLERERDEYRTYVESFRTALSGDEKAFLSEVAKVDPRYARFLAEQAAPPQPQATQMPEPDVPLPDGGRTYSVEGLQKLIEWAVDAKMLPKVEERLQPLTAREQERQQQIAQQRLEQETRQKVGQSIAEAQSWPLFGPLAADGSLTEFQSAVLAELKADSDRAAKAGTRPTMTLRQAYLEVYAKQQEPDKIRERVLAELKSAPKSTSVGRATTDAPKAPGPVSIQDIAARTLDRLERS